MKNTQDANGSVKNTSIFRKGTTFFKGGGKEDENAGQVADNDAMEMTEHLGTNDQDDGSIGEMRRGDYMVHVYLERSKDLKVPENGTVDPVFKITSLGEEAYSTAKDDIGGLGDINWAEHVFIEAKNVEKHRAEKGKIKITLLDKGFLKNTIIGQYEFDLSYIYFMPNHVMLHQWLAISNPNSDDYTQVTGFIKLSINVTCTGDESVPIEDDDGPENPNILMHPSLNPSYYQVILRFFEAQEIPPMDMGIGFLKKAKTDAYFMTEYKHRRIRSNVIVTDEDTPNVEFNQEFWIPAQIPIISKRMTIQVMDKDDMKDEVIGSLLFDIQDMVDGKYKNKFFWKNIYGSPLNQMNSQAKRDMNENPELASNWKGRVLMQIECYQTDKPICQITNVDDRIITKSEEFKVKRKYQMIAEIGQGIALPYNNKFSVKILVGGEEFKTSEAKVVRKDYNRFNERFESRIVEYPYQRIEEFGNIFVLLMDDDKPICFFKQHISKFKNPDAEYKWISFRPDLCVNKVKDANKAGMLSFKFAIHYAEENELNFKEFKAWKKLPPKRLEPIKIRAYIYQCRDLPASDSNGTSDPYVRVWDMSNGKPKRTQTIEDNNNPLFYEAVDLDYEVRDVDDLESYPPFILDVYDEDRDLTDRTDDFLARAIIEPESCVIVKQKEFENDKSKEIPYKPMWHELKFMPGEPKSGEILVSFSISQLEYNYKHPAQSVNLSALVDFKEYQITMLVLGLRQLESPGILPVKKAYIKFNMKSLVPPNSSAIQNIQTQPQNIGPNPTINTTMNVTIPLPTDPLYCPQLSCVVYDHIYKGWNQPRIGVFTIPIGKYMLDLKAERQREIQEIENINQALQSILGGDFATQNFEIINQSDVIRGINYTQLASFSKITDNTGDKSTDQTNNQSRNQIQQSLRGSVGGEIDQTELDMQMRRSEIGNDGIKDNKNDKIGQRNKDIENNNKRRKRKLPGRGLQFSDIQGRDSQFNSEFREPLYEGAQEAEQNQANKEEARLKEIREQRRISKADFIKKQEEEKNKQKKSQKINPKLINNLNEIAKNQKYIQYNPDEMPDSDALPEQIRVIVPSDLEKQETIILENSNLSKKAIKDKLRFDKDQEKRIHEDQRMRAEEDMLEKWESETFNVIIMPKYKPSKRLKIDRECSKPASALYIGLGWDEDSTTQRKHYRRYYDDELENIKEIFPVKSPFHSIELKKGQSRGLPNGLFASMMRRAQRRDRSGANTNEKVVGFFKGIVEVESHKDRDDYDDRKAFLVADLVDNLNKISLMKLKEEFVIDVDLIEDPLERKKLDVKLRKLDISHLNITSHLTNLHSDVILKKQLMVQNQCQVRIYVISAFNLSARDNGSPSDPYIALECNEKVFNERENYKLDDANPQFLKHYDFEATFPGCSPLKIAVWDYDDVFGDDLIGTTSIDLEDRYFTLEWQSMHDKPIEYRQLYHQSSSQEQGVVKCWVEINSATVDPEHIKLWDISEKPPEPFEVRICVFNAVNVKMMDWEGTSDVYFRGFFDTNEDVQETDTHYRCQDGMPDFQYRFVYNINIPRKDYKFTLQAYDRDMFKYNEIIGEASIDLSSIIEDCSLVKQSLTLNERYYNEVMSENKKQKIEFHSNNDKRFWLKLKTRNDVTGREETNGKVLVQVDVVTDHIARKNPVGKARNSPNHSPFLRRPEGRIQISINPFVMYKQLIGPEVRKQICCYLCIIFLFTQCLSIIPQIVSDVFVALISAPFLPA